MKSINQVILLGCLGRKPDLRFMDNKTAVCSFSIATNERYKDKRGNFQERAEWHRIVAFGKLAESCKEYLDKGSRVYVQGKLQARSWKEEGTDIEHKVVEIIVEDIVFLTRAGQPGLDHVDESFPGDQVEAG